MLSPLVLRFDRAEKRFVVDIEPGWAVIDAHADEARREVEEAMAPFVGMHFDEHLERVARFVLKRVAEKQMVRGWIQPALDHHGPLPSAS